MAREIRKKYKDLISLFKKHTYLTSDSFSTPDAEYIYLDGNKIKFRRLDDISHNFDIRRYLNSEFREVKKRFANHSAAYV